MNERERDVEKWLRKEIEKMGGLAFKWTSPGNDGVSDRIVILPGGRVHFVELKTDGGEPRPLQVWQLERLRHLGCNAEVIRGMDEAAAFIEEVRDAIHM